MCGRFNVTDDPKLRALLEVLGVGLNSEATLGSADPFALTCNTTTPSSESQQAFIFSDDIAPASTISVVLQEQHTRKVQTANWWLLQHLQNGQFVPNYQYASFNSRSDKLNMLGSASYDAFRHHRCIIPASGFVEGMGDKKTYHAFIPQQEAIAFAGLYKPWRLPNGQTYYSTSIITVSPHSKMTGVHEKAFPLMLNPVYRELIDAWLDPNFQDVAAFNKVLFPILLQDFTLQPINKPSQRLPSGEPRTVHSDFN